MVLQSVAAKQMELIQMFGPVDNPFVKAQHLDNTLKKFVEAAGLKTPDMYFHSPDEQEVQMLLEHERNKPTEEPEPDEADDEEDEFDDEDDEE